MRPSAQTQRTLSKEFLDMKYSELCELRASVVNNPSPINLEHHQRNYFPHNSLVAMRAPSAIA